MIIMIRQDAQKAKDWWQGIFHEESGMLKLDLHFETTGPKFVNKISYKVHPFS